MKTIEQETIQAYVGQVARSIEEDYQGRNPLLVGVLTGAIHFLSDLSRALNIEHTVDTIQCASYGSGTESSGVIHVRRLLTNPPVGRHLIIVEDIVDTGLTVRHLRGLFTAQGVTTVRTASLLWKPAKKSQRPDYLGTEIPDEFVVGYGMDHDEHYRDLSYITTIDQVTNGNGHVALAQTALF